MKNRLGIVRWASLVLLAGMLLLTACGSDQPAESPDYEMLASGSILGVGPAEPLAVVITEEGELDQLLDVFPKGSRPTEIDAARLDGGSAFVAVFGGSQGSSGYSVALEEIEVEGDGVVLRATLASPPSGQLVEPAGRTPIPLLVTTIKPRSHSKKALTALSGSESPLMVVSWLPSKRTRPLAVPTQTELSEA